MGTQPLTTQACSEPGHPSYDMRWGCPACLTLEVTALRTSVTNWKDAWYTQRAATGKLAWEVPIVTYLAVVPVDPRVLAYFETVGTLLRAC